MPISYSSPRKVSIVGLEVRVDLIAQYNPKEVQIEKSANWTAHATSKQDNPGLEFTSAAARTLSMELLFDTYEEGLDVGEKYVAKLMQLISVMDPDGDEQHKRPSLVQVRWPDRSYATFEGVLESVSTKYTMFSPSGFPVRANCTVKIKEARREFKGEPRRVAPPRSSTRW